MRQIGSAPNAPASGSGLAVVSAAGATFTLSVPGRNNNSQFALETWLAMLAESHTYGASIVGTAGAGNKAIAELNNPAASGANVYLYALDFFVPVAMAINIFVDGTTLTPVGTGANLFPGGAAGIAKVGGGNQLAPTGSLFYTSPSLTANTIYTMFLPYVCAVAQGHNIQLQGQTVNQAFTANVRWYELAT